MSTHFYEHTFFLFSKLLDGRKCKRQCLSLYVCVYSGEKIEYFILKDKIGP